MSKKVLIIEDDEFLRAIAAKKIQGDGYEVAVAVDGPSAVTTAETEKPDLILLDLLLPGLSGFEVLAKIRAMPDLKNIPVLIFSNLGQQEDIEKAKGLGATDFLVKANFTLEEVSAKIKSYLG
jgi:CheY-like chemotaxis protein